MKRYGTMGFEPEYGVWVRAADAEAIAGERDALAIGKQRAIEYSNALGDLCEGSCD